MDQIFHDKIAQICIDHFNTLPKTGKPNDYEWTVLSCIVKEDSLLNHFEVVALGTGSKCIGKSQMSVKGDILNDSHSEVICRRAFVKYIYEQIDCNSETLFTKFTLKDTIRFHFFTSHVPCGDAAIFEPEYKRQKLDKLLTEEGSVRTKPGRGDPTLSVSCSDKITKWSHVGIQGALLMLILKEPIYLHTFTISGQTPFNIDSFMQALYGRCTLFVGTAPYYQHKMVVGQATIGFSYRTDDDKQPCPSSIVWSKTKLALEVAVEGKKQGVTKKNQHKKTGRLEICKIEMFRRFLNIATKLRVVGFSNVGEVKYFEAKMKAIGYQDAWKVLRDEIFKVWTVKDNELLQFSVD